MSSALRILWVKSGPLHPLDTGGKKRSHSMLVELNRHHQVTYLALRDERQPLDPLEEASHYADRRVWIPWREARSGSPRWMLELLANLVGSSLPYALAKYRSRGMAREIQRQLSGGCFDLVVCDFIFPAPNFVWSGRRPPVPVVLFQHNMEAMIWRRLAAGKGTPIARWYFGLQAERMAKWERELSALFDGVVTVSPEDSEVARREYGLPNVLGDVPAGVDTGYFTPVQGGGDGRTIGFLGSMDWMPNIEGVRWFIDHVLPGIGDGMGGVRFLVIGRNPPRALRRLAEGDPQIEVTGTVDDVRPWLGRCDLLVVPLLSGGGTRIKIMEGLAAGLPVVSTTVGAEGLGLTAGEHLLIADSPEDFTGAVTGLLADGVRREQLSRAGRKLVEEQFSWSRASEAFLAHTAKLGLAKEGGRFQPAGR